MLHKYLIKNLRGFNFSISEKKLIYKYLFQFLFLDVLRIRTKKLENFSFRILYVYVHIGTGLLFQSIIMRLFIFCVNGINADAVAIYIYTFFLPCNRRNAVLKKFRLLFKLILMKIPSEQCLKKTRLERWIVSCHLPSTVRQHLLFLYNLVYVISL